ncbi:MAG: CRISPR-associated endonuclease Cas1, partial [Thermodesulfobacteriota bacterium]|nr:CRISPR-associated endonuclease Cas1 [Thermodesulfobacteriota bacterium]
YITTQGARVVREGRHLLVKKGMDVFHTLFPHKLEQLLLFGHVEITSNAMRQLMRDQIDVVFLTQNGRYLGRLAQAEAKNVFLRKRQFLLLDDPAFGLAMAKNIVAGKLSNMATLLMRVKRTRNSGPAGEKARQITDLLSRLAQADTVDAVRGYEGRGSAIYFDGLKTGFVENPGFTRRVRRPPTDPVNSILSLLYTFLMNRVYAAVRVAGLDPYPGFLHTIDYGRYSLVLDLMEEFRTIIADTLTLSLFNLKMVQAQDFYTERPVPDAPAGGPAPIEPDVTLDPMGGISSNSLAPALFDLPEQRMDEAPAGPVTGKYPVRLSPEAFTRVIHAFEKKLTTPFFHPPADRELTYGEALRFQAGQYRKIIEGELAAYQPILLK